MATRRAWLPREGFTADVLARIIQNTAFNPALTLPLLLFAHYTGKGRELSTGHETALKRLKLLLYIGIARLVNGFLSRRAQNNWTSSKYNWGKEIAVVTGGSDGIGKEISLLLAKKGVTVAILDIQPLAFESRSNIHHFTCDITSTESLSEVAATVRSTLGNPTILVNNAGIGNGSMLLNSNQASVEKTFSVNILSHFRTVREFVPSMASTNHGTVVTIASCAAFITTPLTVDYACTKAAALAFHEGLAGELATTYNAPAVRTICVCPSWVKTNMTSTIEVKDKFFIPMQHVETVAEKVVDKIVSGNSGVLVIPEAAGWLCWPLRMMPMWWQVRTRHQAGNSLKAKEGSETEKLMEDKQS